jgi:hypothetical protein
VFDTPKVLTAGRRAAAEGLRTVTLDEVLCTFVLSD